MSKANKCNIGLYIKEKLLDIIYNTVLKNVGENLKIEDTFNTLDDMLMHFINAKTYPKENCGYLIREFGGEDSFGKQITAGDVVRFYSSPDAAIVAQYNISNPKKRYKWGNNK